MKVVFHEPGHMTWVSYLWRFRIFLTIFVSVYRIGPWGFIYCAMYFGSNDLGINQSSMTNLIIVKSTWCDHFGADEEEVAKILPFVRTAHSRNKECLEADRLSKSIKICQKNWTMLDIHTPARVAIRCCASRWKGILILK